MDIPWYRQYFWLLVFGGIILLTVIISIIMICVCRTQISKSVTNRIQKSFKLKKRTKSTIDNSLYHLSGPSEVKLPNWTEKDFAMPPMYATVQTVPTQSPPQVLYPKNYAKKENTDLYIPNLNDRFSYASYDSVGSVSEVSYTNAATAAISKNSVLQPAMYSVVQKMPKQSHLQGSYLIPDYYAKKKNTDSDITNTNDRFSYASYDSVSSVYEDNYTNAALAGVSREYVQVIPDSDYDDVEII
ncbi:SLP adapter and CSK-interacting membrane protein isoform X2 [Pyxicephalus adspersus]|uniref:SLP adapter and CSK-interacting membrane protein isoform X2 n=1 Tax=Pyxicephalus adspersus TaxID=30357 RepID=UPI003B5AFB5B